MVASSCFLNRDRLSVPCNSGQYENSQIENDKRDIFLFPKVEVTGRPACFSAPLLIEQSQHLFLKIRTLGLERFPGLSEIYCFCRGPEFSPKSSHHVLHKNL